MNVLELYQKAQSSGLEMQEAAWIDQITREHPYFGMAYMISARHHLAEKTTVKDSALMAGAAYALDRNLLHRYVADTIAQPRQTKAQSIVGKAEDTELEVLPIAQDQPEEPSPETSPEPQPEPQPETVPGVPEPAELPDGNPEEMPEPLPEELPIFPGESPEEEPGVEPEPEEEPNPEYPEIEPQPAEPETDSPIFESQPLESTPPAKAPEPVGINWFLNMRLKLRVNKYQGLGARIRSSVGTHAANIADDMVSADQEMLAPAVEIKKPEVVASVANEYRIGDSSPFTYVPDQDLSDDFEDEALVIDSELLAVEARLEAGKPREIIFEEEGRILEIVVSPELCERFFKGRLPMDLNMSDLDESRKLAVSGRKGKDGKDSEMKEAEEVLDPAERKRRAAALIDRFIELEPTVSKQPHADLGGMDFSKDSNHDQDEWVTETLAKIYTQQGNRAKAIKIYQKLSLLFPEKRAYFATRIAELK